MILGRWLAWDDNKRRVHAGNGATLYGGPRWPTRQLCERRGHVVAVGGLLREGRAEVQERQTFREAGQLTQGWLPGRF